MMRASSQPADAWAFWFWGSAQVALESAEIMFSHKNVKGYGELSWQYHNNIVFYEFQGQRYEQFNDPCSIAKHESYRPKHISFI